MKTKDTSNSFRVTESSLKLTSDDFIYNNDCQMGTCGYVNQRPPIGKVVTLSLRLTNIIHKFIHKPLLLIPPVIDSVKFRL